jgi:hypothetical protein
MTEACAVRYEEAKAEVQIREVERVPRGYSQASAGRLPCFPALL